MKLKFNKNAVEKMADDFRNRSWAASAFIFSGGYFGIKGSFIAAGLIFIGMQAFALFLSMIDSG